MHVKIENTSKPYTKHYVDDKKNFIMYVTDKQVYRITVSDDNGNKLAVAIYNNDYYEKVSYVVKRLFREPSIIENTTEGKSSLIYEYIKNMEKYEQIDRFVKLTISTLNNTEDNNE